MWKIVRSVLAVIAGFAAASAVMMTVEASQAGRLRSQEGAILE